MRGTGTRAGSNLDLPLVLVAAIALTLALAALPGTAVAAVSWTQPQTLSVAEENAGWPDVGVDAAGNAVAVWWRSPDQLQWSARPAGGNFGSPQNFAETGFGAPKVAVAPGGEAIAVWSRNSGEGHNLGQIRVSTRPPGGAFGPPQTLSAAGVNATGPSVTIGPGGHAVVVWRQSPEMNDPDSLFAAFRPPGGSFGPPQALTEYPVLSGTGNGQAATAVDSQGNVLVLWVRGGGVIPNAIYGRVQANFRSAQSGSWAGQQFISPDGQDAVSPAVGFDSQGNAVALWSQRPGTWNAYPGTSYMRAAFRPAGGGFSAPVQLTTSGLASEPAVALSGSGDAVALWRRSSPDRLQTAFRPAGGSFGTPVDLPGGSAPRSTPRLAIDGQGDVTALWAGSSGEDDVVLAALRPAGSASAFAAPSPISVPGELALESSLDYPPLAVGRDGHAVAAWVRSDGVNRRIQAAIGLPQGAPPPPPPPEPPPPSVPSAIQPAEPFQRGKPVVLTAHVSGPVQRLEWRVDGTSVQPVGTVVNGSLQRSIRLRPRGTSFTVWLKAIGPGGERSFSRSFNAPRPPAGAAEKRVQDALTRAAAPPVLAVGDAAVLTGKSAACGPMTVYSGAQSLSGCMRPITELADIPSAERGVLEPLAAELGLPRTDAALLRTAVALTDGYVARGRTALNEVWPVVPGGGASIVAFPQAKALVSSNAALEVGGYKLGPAGAGFNLGLDPRKANIPLGKVPRPPALPKVAGFELVGDFDVDLAGREARIVAHLKVPSFVKKAGVGLQSRISLRATPDRLIVDDMRIGPNDVDIGALKVNGFLIAYNRAASEWQGQGKACVTSGLCLDMVPPNGQVRIKDGRLDFAGASLHFPTPGVPLWAGVNLERIGFGVGLSPTRFTGNARLGIAQLLVIDGRLVFAFPTAQTPFTLRRDEVGDDFAPFLYSRQYTGTTVGVSAAASLRLPIGETPLARAYLLVEPPSYFALGGGFDVRFASVVVIRGGLDAVLDRSGPETLYFFRGFVEGCIKLKGELCAKGEGAISRGAGGTGGAGICLGRAGGGIQWANRFNGNKTQVFLYSPIGGKACPIVRFVAPEFRSALAAGISASKAVQRVRVRRGERPRAVRIDAAGGAPLLRVRGPGGQVVETVSELGIDESPNRAIRIHSFEGEGETADQNFAIVGLNRPGAYRIERLPSSPTITRVREGVAPAPARARGTVTASGKRRQLTYAIGRRPGQSVALVEIAASGVSRVLGRTKGGRGKLDFRPAPGRGVSRIEAQFTLEGIPAERRVLTRFRPPAPALARPKGLSVKRAGRKLHLGWSRVPGAARYEVAVTAASGAQRFLTVKRPRAVVAKVPRATGGRVTVRAVDALRTGPVAVRRFARTARPAAKLRSLKRCRVVKRKLVCHAKRDGKQRKRR